MCHLNWHYVDETLRIRSEKKYSICRSKLQESFRYYQNQMFMKNSKQFILVCLIGTLFMGVQAMNQLNANTDHKMNVGNDIPLDLPIKYCKSISHLEDSKCSHWCVWHKYRFGKCEEYKDKIICVCA
ncbi:unnamed protein product [Adineta ricciae]|uniref:Uncharacterized protein n=1 Tax=Adineta ricciae TaxID=249248 RepID=A0A814VS40_ADIRI|nr:unnamed protein product [Adineta ricciae]